MTAGAARGPLADLVALVTGGSSGIGSATVAELARAGATVVAVSRRPAALGRGITGLQLDLAVPGAAEAAVERVATDHGRLDIVVHCAGLMLVEDVESANSADWRAMLEVNEATTFDLVRCAIPHLERAAVAPRGSADIVLVGSTSARAPTAGRAVYAATKAAVRAFADAVRQELATRPIRVGIVDPGLTATSLRAANPPHRLEAMRARMPDLEGVRPLDPGAVSAAIRWMVTRPADVSIAELVVLPTSQGR